MGYKVQQTIYKLRFAEDDEFAGVEVKARGVGMGKLLKLGKLVGKLSEGAKETDFIEAMEDEVLVSFAKSLVSWNLEDEDDNPIPATLESLMDDDLLPPKLVFTIISEWIEQQGAVDGPLDGSSVTGKNSEVPSALTAVS
jgi:hypothetical protein